VFVITCEAKIGFGKGTFFRVRNRKKKRRLSTGKGRKSRLSFSFKDYELSRRKESQPRSGERGGPWEEAESALRAV